MYADEDRDKQKDMVEMNSLFGDEGGDESAAGVGAVFLKLRRHKDSPPISPPSNLRHLFRRGFILRRLHRLGFLLRQGFGGQDGGQDDRQTSPSQWFFQGLP